jgi:hypothetical protein
LRHNRETRGSADGGNRLAVECRRDPVRDAVSGGDLRVQSLISICLAGALGRRHRGVGEGTSAAISAPIELDDGRSLAGIEQVCVVITP